MAYRVEIYSDGSFRPLPLTRDGLPSLYMGVEGEVPFSVEGQDARFEVYYERGGLDILKNRSWGRILWDEVPIFYGVVADETIISPRQGVASVRLVSPLPDLKRLLLGRRFGGVEPLYRYRKQVTEGSNEYELIALPIAFLGFNAIEKLGWEKVYLFGTPIGGRFGDLYEQDVGYEITRQAGSSFVFRRPLARGILGYVPIEEIMAEISRQVELSLGIRVNTNLSGYSPIQLWAVLKLMDEPFYDLAFYHHRTPFMMGIQDVHKEFGYYVGTVTIYGFTSEIDLEPVSREYLKVGFDVEDSIYRLKSSVESVAEGSAVYTDHEATWQGFIDDFTYVTIATGIYRYRGALNQDHIWRVTQWFAVQYDMDSGSWRYVVPEHKEVIREEFIDQQPSAYQWVEWRDGELVLSTNPPQPWVSPDPRYRRVRGGDLYLPFFQGELSLRSLMIEGRNLEVGALLKDLCILSNSVVTVEAKGVDEVDIIISSRNWGGLDSGFVLPEPLSWRYRMMDYRFEEVPELSTEVLRNSGLNDAIREFYRREFATLYTYIDLTYFIDQMEPQHMVWLKPLRRWVLPHSIREALGVSEGVIWKVSITGTDLEVTIKTISNPLRGFRVAN